MLTEVSAHTAAPAPAPPTAPADAAPARSAWWVRLLARVPWAVGDGFATVLGWLAFRVFPYRGEAITHRPWHAREEAYPPRGACGSGVRGRGRGSRGGRCGVRGYLGQHRTLV